MRNFLARFLSSSKGYLNRVSRKNCKLIKINVRQLIQFEIEGLVGLPTDSFEKYLTYDASVVRMNVSKFRQDREFDALVIILKQRDAKPVFGVFFNSF